MNKLPDFLNGTDEGLFKKTLALSDKIWEAAETAFTEVKSAGYLKAYLQEEGFAVESGTGGIDTAFAAVYGEGRPVIGFLAEYDALSGLSQEADAAEAKPLVPGAAGHGCGHNLLGSGCALAGVLVKRYLEETGIPGTVIVYGCPAEEGGSGKTFMAGRGVFKDLDCALSWHPAEYSGVVPVSTMANIQANYRFKGKASHAATAPFMGRSALDAVELMNVGCNYLREHIPPGCMLHYAVLDTGGFAPNVVQASAESTYLIRGEKVEDAAAVKERIDQIARGAAMMTETEVSIIFKKACSHYLPNSVLGKVVTESIREIGLPEYTEEERSFAGKIRETTPGKGESTGLAKNLFLRLSKPEEAPLIEEAFSADINTCVLPATKLRQTVPGSTDVGDVSLNCPVSWFNFVTCAQGTPAHSWQMVAQGKASIAHKGMIRAGKILALSAVRLYEDSTLLEQARAEFKAETGGKPYVCPIPESGGRFS